MQELRCTVRRLQDLEGPRHQALLTRFHPSTARDVPVVVVDGKAAGARDLAGPVVLDDKPTSQEARALVRTARMNGYKVESPR